MRWTLAELAAAAGGRAAAGSGAGGEVPGGTVGGGASTTGMTDPTPIDGIAVDSRRLLPGQAFVALRAERDGHDFLEAAAKAGAAAVVVEAGRAVPAELPAVQVPDTAVALLGIGSAARERLTGPVVGITGSVGKTSTKDLTAAAIAAGKRVASSEESFNNEIGVPLTLANAPESSEVAVLEMGARAIGDIARLCEVARPTVGIVTAVALAHASEFKTLENVARAKGELVAAVPAGGLAVLNGDDPAVSAMSALTAREVLRYSLVQGDVVASGITLDEWLRPKFVLHTPWGTTGVELGVHGAHQVPNALAAAAAALWCGVPLEAVSAGLASAQISHWRMQLAEAPGGAIVVNDAYNANPTSMAAALRALASLPRSRKWAVLGPMAERGEGGADEHAEVARLAAELGVVVIAVGTSEYGVAPAGGQVEVLERLGALGPDDAVLVKASRVSGLEVLAARLVGAAVAAKGLNS